MIVVIYDPKLHNLRELTEREAGKIVNWNSHVLLLDVDDEDFEYVERSKQYAFTTR